MPRFKRNNKTHYDNDRKETVKHEKICIFCKAKFLGGHAAKYCAEACRREHRKTIDKFCPNCGNPVATNNRLCNACLHKKYTKKDPTLQTDKYYKKQLCWSCINAVPDKADRGCSWSKKLIPVVGAKRNETNHIYSCPDFRFEGK